MREENNIKKQAIMIIILSSILFLVFCSILFGQTINNKQFSRRIDSLLKGRFISSEPGAAVAVIVKGKPIFEKCYGLANLEYNLPITSKTMFNLASVAKQFTAFSILLLEKEGKLNMEDDIHKYLPDLPDYSETVTIRNLLNHTSGIWEYSSTMLYYCGYNEKDSLTLNEIMELLKHQRKLLFHPGSQWLYCNTNYLLLAQIVEKITGVTFQEWTKKSIFNPLGMKNSLFIRNSSQLIPGKADSYRKIQEEFVDASSGWRNAVGMGYLFTNIEEMMKWMDNFRTMKVGGKDVIEKMFQKTTLNNGEESFYGYGVGIGTRSGKMTIGHTGQTDGYKTAVLYCPELELGIAVLANNRSIDSETLANTIFDLYLGEEPKSISFSGKKQEKHPLDRESAVRYTGGYILEGPNIKIATNLEDDYFHGAIFGMGEDYFYPIAENKFSNLSKDNTIEFLDIKDGKSQTAIITARGKKMTAKRIMFDQQALKSHISEYAGNYYSETFDTVYSIHVEKDKLIVHHKKYGDMSTEPIDKDEFFFDLGFLKFNRDQNGDVAGFTLTPSDEKFNFQGIELIKIK